MKLNREVWKKCGTCCELIFAAPVFTSSKVRSILPVYRAAKEIIGSLHYIITVHTAVVHLQNGHGMNSKHESKLCRKELRNDRMG